MHRSLSSRIVLYTEYFMPSECTVSAAYFMAGFVKYLVPPTCLSVTLITLMNVKVKGQ
jgi:hypothetical protein